MSDHDELREAADAILALLPLSDDGTGHVSDCGYTEEAPSCGCYDLPRRIAAVLVPLIREREALLTQAMWDALGILGFDQDGDKTPAALIAGMGTEGFVGAFLRDVREAREHRNRARTGAQRFDGGECHSCSSTPENGAQRFEGDA